MCAISLTPPRPLIALILLKIATEFHLTVCLLQYNEHAHGASFLSEVNLRAKLLILEAVQLMDSVAHSLGLRGL